MAFSSAFAFTQLSPSSVDRFVIVAGAGSAARKPQYATSGRQA
jgi:hypothetical protein